MLQSLLFCFVGWKILLVSNTVCEFGGQDKAHSLMLGWGVFGSQEELGALPQGSRSHLPVRGASALQSDRVADMPS